MTKILTTLFLILLAATVTAQADINAMTPDELQIYVQQLQQEAIDAQRPTSPIVVSVQIDEDLRQSIDMLQNEVNELKQTNQRMQERFAQFVTDNKINIEASQAIILSQTKNNVLELLVLQSAEIKEWVRFQTNPVRMNLPTVGIFLMLSAIFLLWTSKTYKGAS